MAKMNNVRYLSNKEQDAMCARGWRVRNAENYCETAEEMFARLSKHYNNVKIYYASGIVRGYHTLFAMVK